MRNYLLYIGAACILASCNNEEANKQTNETLLETAGEVSTVKSDTLCYLYTEGKKQQDSTFLNLIITGDKVSGKLYHMPYEKDSRRGTLSGKKKGEKITATWTYMQEGMDDSTEIYFRLNNNTLAQKLSTFDDNDNDKQYFPNNTQYYRVFKKADCVVVNNR